MSDADHFLLGLPPEESADPAERSGPDTGLPAAALTDGMRTELERQNEALRYSQQVAEGALERFATLFSNVPLALMVVDELTRGASAATRRKAALWLRQVSSSFS